eukprot:2881883-Prymnesium_polylepis.2
MHFRSLSPETRVTFAYYPPVATPPSTLWRISYQILCTAANTRQESWALEAHRQRDNSPHPGVGANAKAKRSERIMSLHAQRQSPSRGQPMRQKVYVTHTSITPATRPSPSPPARQPHQHSRPPRQAPLAGLAAP